MKTVKSLRFGQLVYKLRYDEFNDVFDSMICILDKSLNEHFVGSLGAYTKSDWQKQIEQLDKGFILICYKNKVKDRFGRRNRLQLGEKKNKTSIGIKTFDNLMDALKSMILKNDFNSAKDLTQDDIFKYMAMNNNWLGFEVGQLSFHLTQYKGTNSLHYINTLTEQNNLIQPLDSIDEVSKNVIEMVDVEINKLYNELEKLKDAKKHLSSILKNIG